MWKRKPEDTIKSIDVHDVPTIRQITKDLGEFFDNRDTCTLQRGLRTAYRKRGTINLNRIGLIEKRLVQASACLFVGMSDDVGHGRLNGPWNAAPTPPVYSLYSQTRTSDRSPTPPMGPPFAMDAISVLHHYRIQIFLRGCIANSNTSYFDMHVCKMASHFGPVLLMFFRLE